LADTIVGIVAQIQKSRNGGFAGDFLNGRNSRRPHGLLIEERLYPLQSFFGLQSRGGCDRCLPHREAGVRASNLEQSIGGGSVLAQRAEGTGGRRAHLRVFVAEHPEERRTRVLGFDARQRRRRIHAEDARPRADRATQCLA